jgi:hypothetical protein
MTDEYFLFRIGFAGSLRPGVKAIMGDVKIEREINGQY